MKKKLLKIFIMKRNRAEPEREVSRLMRSDLVAESSLTSSSTQHTANMTEFFKLNIHEVAKLQIQQAGKLFINFSLPFLLLVCSAVIELNTVSLSLLDLIGELRCYTFFFYYSSLSRSDEGREEKIGSSARV